MDTNVKKRLVMTFKTADERTVSLSIDDPREDLSENEIKTAMELVVSKNIFAPGGTDIAKAISAKTVVTDTTNYDLVL